MSFPSCAARVSHALQGVPGVGRVAVDLLSGTATLETTGAGPPRNELAFAVRSAGYDIASYREGTDPRGGLELTLSARIREQRQAALQAAGLGIPIVALHWLGPVLQSGHAGGSIWPGGIQALLLLVLLLSSACAPILVGGLRALVYAVPGVDLLPALGIAVACAAAVVQLLERTEAPPAFASVALVILVISVGRLIELVVRRKAVLSAGPPPSNAPRTAGWPSEHDIAAARDDGTHVAGDSAAIHFSGNAESMIAAAARMSPSFARMAGAYPTLIILLSIVTVGFTRLALETAWSTALVRAASVLLIGVPTAIGLAAWTEMATAGAPKSPDGHTGSAARPGDPSKHVQRQNRGWAMVYNVAAVSLAALGVVPPPWAAAAAITAAILVVLNAQRMPPARAPMR